MENKKMKLLAKSLAKDMIRRDMKKWPPDCLGLTYQPMRPMRHNELDSKTEADRQSKRFQYVIFPTLWRVKYNCQSSKRTRLRKLCSRVLFIFRQRLQNDFPLYFEAFSFYLTV